MKTLLAFATAQDPFLPGAGPGCRFPGPLLAVLGVRLPERLVLCAPDPGAARFRAIGDAVRARHPRLPVERAAFAWNRRGAASLADGLRGLLNGTGGDADLAVSLVGAPAPLQAAVLALAAGGLRAWILQGDPVEIALRGPEALREAPPARVPGMPAPRVAEPAAAYRVGRVGWMASAGSDAAAPGSSRPAAELARAAGMVGEHPSLRRALEACAAVAPHRVPVLVQGETGSGKELAARLIHRLSGRPAARFVPVNCGALPERLVESILFGHAKGAFTGAQSDHDGKFVEADGGTLFLDEVGELPLELQPRLLRVLEDGCVEPVGARAARPVDARVVAATHRDLAAAVASGSFRADLFHRLGVALVLLPPLRERRSDIAATAAHVLDRLNRSLARPLRLAPSAVARLEAHPWPGNVRELENVLTRAALGCRGSAIEAADLLFTPASADRPPPLPEPHAGFSIEEYLDQARRALFLRALERAGGVQAAAARLLGVSPQAVHKFLLSHRPAAEGLNPG